MTGRFGLLGEHLSHSFSPKIHAMLGNYNYGLYEVPPEGLGDFLCTTPLDGMNVTIPYKKAVLPYCSELSPAAERIGSVNTLVRRDGGWYGDNTDAFGLQYLLNRCGCEPAGKVCAVFGTGGASVTVQAVLAELGAAKVYVLSRSGRNDYAHLGDYADAQILVNATPAGMYPDCDTAAASASAFPACEAVIDLIYNPLRTDLLQETMQQTFRGRRIIAENGLAMLVAQAAGSAALFTGEAISEELMEETLCKLKSEAENLVLIGMPGCGKTTVGRALAKALGRTFVDLDTEIAKASGIDPETWIRIAGEDVFRAAETETLRSVSKRTGIVLACGGGVVTRPENEALLRRNGKIIWLRRELCKLETRGRPLSKPEKLAEMYAVREPLYRQFSDLCADNNGTPEEAVQAILEAIS